MDDVGRPPRNDVHVLNFIDGNKILFTDRLIKVNMCKQDLDTNWEIIGA